MSRRDAQSRPLGEPEPTAPRSASLPRGSQARAPLKAGIIGGGQACFNLLQVLARQRLSLPGLRVLGVADPNPKAPGLLLAKELGLFTTHDLTELYDLPGLDMLIELTGSDAVRQRMIRTKPLELSSIDHRGARLLWDLVQSQLEKARAEQTIKLERDWFQEIIDSLPDKIVVLNRDLTIVAVNKTFVRSSGLDEAQVTGRSCLLVRNKSLSPCQGGEHRNPFQEVLDNGRPASLVHAHAGPQGQTVYEEMSATPLFNPQGQVSQVVIAMRNITRRVCLENELRDAEQKLRQLMEAAQDIVCIKDLEGRYLYVNPAAAELNGLAVEQMLGRTDHDLFPPAVARGIRAHDQEVIAHQATLCFLETMRGPQGTRQFQTVRYPILNDRGQMAAVSIMSRDVTEEKQLQEQVRRARDYLEAVLKNSSDMIITTNLLGRIVTFSPSGKNMLGYAPEEIQGQDVEVLWQNPDQRRALAKQVKAHGAVNNFPATLVAKDGRPVEISLSLAQLKDSRGRVLGTVGVSKDVTEENRLRQQLIENERLAAIGQTVAGVAHCIKNILNGLKGGSYMVETGLEQDKPQRVVRGWRNVQKSIARISDLSHDMLSYCRERRPQLEPLDPGELAQGVLDLVIHTAGLEGVRATVAAQPGPEVKLDATGLSRVLLNLLSNALDACRERDYEPGQEPRVELEVIRLAGEICFKVCDNGVGMDDKVQRQLFQRFFSTKEYRGTGLGLPVVQKIVAEHGGRVEVDSQPGRGSCFSVYLPLR